MRYLAQNLSIGGQTIQGPLRGPQGQEIKTVGDIISILITFLIPMGGILFLLVIIWGGIDIIMSQGSPEKWKTARLKITYGLVGIVLLVVSFLLIKLIEVIFGLNTGIF